MTINPFEFRTVPSMEMAWGGAKRIGEIIAARFAARKVLLVTDAGLVKAGMIAPIAASLEAAGFSVAIFDKVVADPPESVLYGCVEEARQVAADIVIGLGGGSSLDIAKLAAVLLSTEQSLADMYGVGKVQARASRSFSFRRRQAQVPKSPIFPSSPPARRPRWGSCRRSYTRISCCWMQNLPSVYRRFTPPQLVSMRWCTPSKPIPASTIKTRFRMRWHAKPCGCSAAILSLPARSLPIGMLVKACFSVQLLRAKPSLTPQWLPSTHWPIRWVDIITFRMVFRTL